uniref:CAZy families GT5 protein n=1 Tax=uncultured Lactobacillus sp. TaxID=153152 RepID=A0A060BWC4_9LACO|nr:CAZy families GT5 protein [uncultured Lactobacillus sp.]
MSKIDFDITLAQQIYGGCDLFLMPSAFEPCGLSQMIAMRYGTLPIVHQIGGLQDSVQPYNPFDHSGTGFGFSEYSSFYFNGSN